MKKILFVMFAAFLAIGVDANAQSWGAGLKVGSDYGINVKRYMGGNAWEVVGAFHRGGFNVLGLYEWNISLGNGFTFYYGFGANLGVWDKNDDDDSSDFGLGIDGVVGVEWQLPNNIPFALTLDWTPQFQLIPETEFWAKGISFGIKYVW